MNSTGYQWPTYIFALTSSSSSIGQVESAMVTTMRLPSNEIGIVDNEKYIIVHIWTAGDRIGSPSIRASGGETGLKAGTGVDRGRRTDEWYMEVHIGTSVVHRGDQTRKARNTFLSFIFKHLLLYIFYLNLVASFHLLLSFVMNRFLLLHLCIFLYIYGVHEVLIFCSMLLFLLFCRSCSCS